MSTPPRALRADAERTERAVLEAAERVLSADPTASIGRIAEAAGVARTTVHRRFASREALITALAVWATEQFREAVCFPGAETAPPEVALHQVTVNVLRVKTSWGFAMSALPHDAAAVASTHRDVLQRCERLFGRLEEAGSLRRGMDLEWVRRVYYALIHEAATRPPVDDEPEVELLAARVVDTLLNGVGARPGR